MYVTCLFIASNFVLITLINCEDGYNPHAITRRTDPIACDDPNPDKHPMCYYWIHNKECSLNWVIPRLCPKGCQLCDKTQQQQQQQQNGYSAQGAQQGAQQGGQQGGQQQRPSGGGQYGAVLREVVEAPYPPAKQLTDQGSNADNFKLNSYDRINSATTKSQNNVQINNGYSPVGPWLSAATTGSGQQTLNQPYNNGPSTSKSSNSRSPSSTLPITTSLNNAYANTIENTANSDTNGSINPTTAPPSNGYSPPVSTNEQPTPQNPYGNTLTLSTRSQASGSTSQFLANRTVASTEESETDEPLYHTKKPTKAQANQNTNANVKTTKRPVEKDPFLASSVGVTKFDAGRSFPFQKKDVGEKGSNDVQWAEWNAWGKCTLGRQFRARTCSRGVSKVCTGSDFDFRLCDTFSF